MIETPIPEPIKIEESEKIKSLELWLAGTIKALKETEKLNREKDEKIRQFEDELDRWNKTIESLNSTLNISKINTV